MASNNSVNVPLAGNTGTGNFVGATSPTLVTPLLGTPTSGTLTNCTGLPIAGIASGTVSAAHVTNSSGTSLFTSSLTNGQVVIGSTGGTPVGATLTQGSGITITNGAGTITIASSGGAGGAWAYLDTKTAASSPSITFTNLDSTYYTYQIRISQMLAATNAVNLRIRTSANNGVSYDSGGTDYNDPSGGGSSIKPFGTTTSGNAAGQTNWGEINIVNPSAAVETEIFSVLGLVASGSNMACVAGCGKRLSAAAVNAVQITFSSGAIASGIFKLYGLVPS